GMPGDVEVEFVVDATGDIRMDTFGVVSATHPQLVEAVRRSLVDCRFVPARKAGVAVAQLVQYPVRFEPPVGSDRVPPT
ncbi:MAG: energy transducer TonB, partial [Gemmatimonadota bacterium]